MGGDFIDMVQYSRSEHSWGEMYLQGMIDGYNRERKRILSKRRETVEKEAKEMVLESGLLAIIKEAARKELEEVGNKWKEIVSEKDRRISELQKEVEEEVNGRRRECEEIRRDMTEQRKIMEDMQVQKKRMEEEMNRKIENESEKAETDSRNWRKVEEMVKYERRRNKEEVGKIRIEVEVIKEEKVREKIQKEKEGKEKEKEREEAILKQLEDFVRKNEWEESKMKLWEKYESVRQLLCALRELFQNGYREPG